MYTFSSIMNKTDIDNAILRMSYEIIESHKSLQNLAFIGIRKRGDILAERFIDVFYKINKTKALFGTIDISLYRDDFSQLDENLVIGQTNILFDVSAKDIILVDDVLHTGRTIRAAIDQIIDFGRPSKIELAVLIDRGGRELPISPNYCGKAFPFEKNRYIQVKLEEDGKDEVVFISKKEKD